MAGVLLFGLAFLKHRRHICAISAAMHLLWHCCLLPCGVGCGTPMSRRLHYQLEQYLIPALCSKGDLYHPLKLRIPVTAERLENRGGVATGFSGGVDSMYTLMTHIGQDMPGIRLTHLLIANVGTLESDHNTQLLRVMAQNARMGIAGELGLRVITVDSNLQILQEQHYLSVAVYRIPAAVLALQNLFRVFLHSGAYEFSHFSFVAENTAYYEILPLSCFETDTTVFYSTESHISRIQKLKELSDFPLAWKYLHPCIYAEGLNCGRCGKCVRTQGALYALGQLDKFDKVFILDDFYKNKENFLAQILARKESQHYGEVTTEMTRRGLAISPEIQRKSRILRAASKVIAKAPILKKE